MSLVPPLLPIPERDPDPLHVLVHHEVGEGGCLFDEAAADPLVLSEPLRDGLEHGVGDLRGRRAPAAHLVIAQAPLNQQPREPLGPDRGQLLELDDVVQEEGRSGSLELVVDLRQHDLFHHPEVIVLVESAAKTDELGYLWRVDLLQFGRDEEGRDPGELEAVEGDGLSQEEPVQDVCGQAEGLQGEAELTVHSGQPLDQVTPVIDLREGEESKIFP